MKTWTVFEANTQLAPQVFFSDDISIGTLGVRYQVSGKCDVDTDT